LNPRVGSDQRSQDWMLIRRNNCGDGFRSNKCNWRYRAGLMRR